jgi:hypothetical protein
MGLMATDAGGMDFLNTARPGEPFASNQQQEVAQSNGCAKIDIAKIPLDVR